MSKPVGRTVGELGRALRSGDLSCGQLASRVLADVERRDGELRSLAGTTAERALRESERAAREAGQGRSRGPLHGIPYVVKDVFDVAGEPTTMGTPLLGRERATRDAAAVQRLRNAGAVLVGRARCGPLAATIIGVNHAEPTPRNPWRASAVPGGSSSGSAVAVAAGLVPFALGSDTGGSVRVPAALCGVTGYKPTFGRIDTAGMRPLAPALDTVGILASTVADAATVTEVLCGEPLGTAGGVAGLRLALCETLFFEDAEGDVSDAVREAARVLQDLGATVPEVELPELEELHAIAGETSLLAAEAYPLYREVVDHPESDWVMHWLRGAAAFSEERVASCRKRVERLAAKLEERLRGIDAVLAPTTPRAAPPIQACDTPSIHVEMNALLSRNTRVGNLAGWCGLSLPCGRSGDGLPVGLMVYSAAGGDATALRVGRAYQAATSWAPLHGQGASA